MSSIPATSVAAPSKFIRVLAYAAIYFLWGASFLAIRVIVASVPPLLAAGVRFFCAGLILFVWAAMRGAALPKLYEWRSALLLGVGMFACNYGPLFWAEQRVASGIAAIVSALIPVWIAAFEWMKSRSRTPVPLIIGTVSGLGGVTALSLTPGHASGKIGLLPLAALLFGTVAWAVGTIWSQRLSLPASKPMAASIQMLLGGVTLMLVSLALGDLRRFSFSTVDGRVVFSMVYLILGASIIAFTAYVWLLGHDEPTRVASYAYVNPVIAVLLGWLLGGEKLSIQVILGMILVLVGVTAVLRQRRIIEQ
ncbi:MAG TPA: EamA family transporter [Terriglobales bacterium]|jgi:drug/metabolite transporter (DMT)-like permease|nr:EamA family transporter [Terriglobales bacterium]